MLNVTWARAKVPRSLNLAFFGWCLDEGFSSSQQHSTPLTRTPVRAENPVLSFPGLLALTPSLSDWKALRGGKIICIFKSDTAYILSRAGFTSDLTLGCRAVFTPWPCQLFSSMQTYQSRGRERWVALLSTAFWLALGAPLGSFTSRLRRESKSF